MRARTQQFSEINHKQNLRAGGPLSNVNLFVKRVYKMRRLFYYWFGIGGHVTGELGAHMAAAVLHDPL